MIEVFQNHFASWSSGVVEAVPLQWGPFCSFCVNLSATFLELENTMYSGGSLWTSCWHAIGKAINHTRLLSSWGDTFACGFSSDWLYLERPRDLGWINFKVVKKETVSLKRILVSWLWAWVPPWSTGIGPLAFSRAGIDSYLLLTSREEKK